MSTPFYKDQAFFSSQEYGPYAVIDLGSHTCRLLIVGKIGNSLERLDVFSRFTRLGQGVSQTGLLSEKAMERTLEALEICVSRMAVYKPKTVWAIATEAVRRAENKEFFLHQVHKYTGLSLEIISQNKEAQLALKGGGDLLDIDYPYALVFDVGGGSTECIWARRLPGREPEMIDYISLPFGVVTLIEEYAPYQAKGYRLIQERTTTLLEEFSERHQIAPLIAHNQVQLLGTSGTATTVLAIHKGLKYYERVKAEGATLQYAEIFNAIKIVQMMSLKERNQTHSIGKGRGELVLGGFAILEGICHTWPINVMKVTDRGVREGMAAEIAFGKESFLSYRSYEKLEAAA